MHPYQSSVEHQLRLRKNSIYPLRLVGGLKSDPCDVSIPFHAIVDFNHEL